MAEQRPNILYIMTDQQRFDTIAALGNEHVYTPNFDRLVRRGLAFTNAYSSCPVCVPARYNIRTGCEPATNGCLGNCTFSVPPHDMEDRCGPFLARRMTQLGYRTFGIGKFHAVHDDLGYETYLMAEEMFGTSPEDRKRDAFASFIAEEHPEFSHVEQLHGERTEMYYMPQISPLPAEITFESWAADSAINQMAADDDRPFFGFVSFIGPHPPLAPPIPFNRMYDPDRMPDPIEGNLEIDYMDEQLPWMNYIIWADEIGLPRARTLKARYYAEVSYIDWCLGKILDAVEARPDAGNTLICFFADHGDMMGDHHAWQKESYFESACHVPYLLSWPARLPADERRDDLVCLTDLFGIATTAAGSPEHREGIDVLGTIEGTARPREHFIGAYELPGAPLFKIMVRSGDWKYIYIANGGREQLFNVAEDPQELKLRNADRPNVVSELRSVAEEYLRSNAPAALENGKLKAFPYKERERNRIYQFDQSRGVTGFPKNPGDVVQQWLRSQG